MAWQTLHVADIPSLGMSVGTVAASIAEGLLAST